MNDRDWMRRAACRDCPDDDHDAAFGPTEAEQRWFIAAYCTRCPVAADCYDYAEQRNIRDGVYGGLPHRQRNTLRRRAG